jgi:hypothetical protein
MLYALPDRAPPQEVLRITSKALFSTASFVAHGHVLITTVHYPPDYPWDARLNIIGGRPLERLACRLSNGSLENTVAVELLSGFDAGSLNCAAVAREAVATD